MYLPSDYWSPRYDSTFFTVQLTGKQRLHELPSVPATLQGKERLPAWYYQVQVRREHQSRTLLRRYSHFATWLEQLSAQPPPMTEETATANVGPLRLPPGTCPWQWQDEAFAQNRMEQLQAFVEDVLGRPGYASHPATLAFFELNDDEASETTS